jgi:hypothetical protein
MRKTWRAATYGVVTLGVMAAGALGATRASAAAADEAGVRQTAETYFQAQATGRGELLRQAFHPDAKLFSMRDGKVSQLTLDEFVGRFKGQPAPDEAKRKRRVVSVDVTGTAATAKIELENPDAHIVDYMSLLKVDGSWKIVNKTFHVDRKLERRSAPPKGGLDASFRRGGHGCRLCAGE